MQLSHTRRVVSASFDDPNLVSATGLVPVMALAKKTGLGHLVDECLSLSGYAGVEKLHHSAGRDPHHPLLAQRSEPASRGDHMPSMPMLRREVQNPSRVSATNSIACSVRQPGLLEVDLERSLQEHAAHGHHGPPGTGRAAKRRDISS